MNNRYSMASSQAIQEATIPVLGQVAVKESYLDADLLFDLYESGQPMLTA